MRVRTPFARRWIAGAALVLVTLTACGKKDAPEATDPSQAAPAAPAALRLNASDIAEVTESSVTGGIELSGPLDAATTVVVKAQVDGTLRGLKVDRGSAVSQGQHLVTIEGQGLEEQQIAAKAAVASAVADLAVADQNLAASTRLAAAGALSQIDLKSAQAQQQAAAARLESARAQERVAVLRAQYGNVTAPITGAVSERAAEDGQAIRTGDPILTLVDPRTLELRGRIGVEEAGGVRVGQRVVFTLDAMPNRTFTGSVARIDPSADPATRQVGVYARLDNGGRAIVAGQFARGRIENSTSKGKALVVPANAIRTDADGATYVFVIVDNKAVRRPVTTGTTDQASGLTVVTSGVAAGEKVLATTAAIAEGAPVQMPGADSRKGN